MKVSVIVPCFNGSAYIDKCIKCINDDKLKEKEIIFVNDGSSDNSLDILKKYEKKYQNIIVIDQKNSGQGIARNKALKKAKGEFVFFLDVDDYVAKNTFYKMYNYAKKNDFDYVYCDFYEHYENDDKIIKNHHTDEIKKDAILANFAPWAKLISRNLINKINFSFVEGHIFEDIAVIPHLAASANNPGYLEEPLYYYNMSNTSTTRSHAYDKKYEDIIVASDHMYNLFNKDNLLEKYKEEIRYIYLDGILKSGVLKFAKYKEGIEQIEILRNNVEEKFSNLLNNKYYKNEPFYRKMTAYIAVKFPPKAIAILKSIKR